MADKVRPEACFDKIATAGRPKLALNDTGKAVVTNLAAIMCTDEEMASVLGVTVETLQNDVNLEAFLECKKTGRANGKRSLRRIQFDLAPKSAAMAIFLGKQYLGQSDNGQIDIPTDKDGNEDELSKAMRELAEEMNDNADIE